MPILALLLAAAVASTKPVPAPPVFVTNIHALTFQSPAHVWVCPLQADWQGSDHGTVLFLTRPTACLGTGFPSDARNISDDKLVPEIEVYYGYDDVDPPSRCNKVGTTRLMNAMHLLCRKTVEGGVQVTVESAYMADIASLVEITLTTTTARLAQDLPVLRAVAATVAPCKATDYDAHNKPELFGTGAICPRKGQYF
jgi:hypothetical protein